MDLFEAIEKLNEAYSIGNGIIASTSGYDFLNWLDGKVTDHRFLYDENINMYISGNSYDYIHKDLFDAALEEGLYEFPFTDENDGETYNSAGEMEEYRKYSSSILLSVFTPNFASDDGFNARYLEDTYRYAIEFDALGTFYLRDTYNVEFFEGTDLYEETRKRYGKPKKIKV